MMHFDFSTLINATFVCSILTLIIYRVLLNHKMLIQFGTSLILGLTFVVMLRFLLPVEFSFTRSILIRNVYPEIYRFFTLNFTLFCGVGISVNDILRIIWIAGSSFFVLRSLIQYRNLYQSFQSCPPTDDQSLNNLLQEINQHYRVHRFYRNFCIKKTARVTTPMVFGIKTPCIMLPECTLSSEEYTHIFRHELTHYYHGHLFYKLLCEFICDIYWWNPFVYLFRHSLNNILELDADAKVTGSMEDPVKLDYLLCLTKLAKWRATQPKLSAFPAAFAPASHSYLSRRFSLITDKIEHKERDFYLPALLVGALTAFVCLGSLLYTVEPQSTSVYTYPSFGYAPCFSFSNKGTFLVQESPDEYTLYVNCEICPIDILSDHSQEPDVRIYSSYEEALEYELY